LHLAENLYLDLEKSSIKVQVVSPGFVKTRLTDKNTFSMPFIVSAEEAAQSIKKGMLSNCFEIHFPKRFTYIMKFISSLPYALSLPLLKKV
jgi:short-subunit dehydrogenase